VARLSLIAFAKRGGLSLGEIRLLLRPGPTHERWREARTHRLDMLRKLQRLLREQGRLLRATQACGCTTAEECGAILSRRRQKP
jgi:DNA-binding transcriptional MerR regulator